MSSHDDADAPPIMGAVERNGDRARFVIADIRRDEAWLALDDAAAPTLTEWV